MNTKVFKDIHFVYFDNAATSLKPQVFVEEYARLSALKIEYSEAPFIELIGKLAGYLGVSERNISLTYNATYAVNEIVDRLGKRLEGVKKIYLSQEEHLANVYPWRCFALERGIEIVFFKLEEYRNIEVEEGSLISLVSLSNLTGIYLSIEKISEYFLEVKKHKNVLVVVDVSQEVQHHKISLKGTGVDYCFFTAHKFYGPLGLGIIYSKEEYELSYSIDRQLDIRGVMAWLKSFDQIAELFESGEVKKKEESLMAYFRELFLTHKEMHHHLKWVNKNTRVPVFLFKSLSVPAHDFLFYLDRMQITVRAGLSCSYSPSLKEEEGSLFRISLAFNNELKELQYLFKVFEEFKIDKCF